MESPSTHSTISGALAWGFCALILIGYIAFRTEGTLARGNKMSPDRALFATVNAATLTGFQQNLAIDHYNAPGQWMMLILTIGGTQFALIAGGIAVSRIARLPYTDRQIVIASIVIQIVALLIGSITLHRANQPLVATLIQCASALGNSGIWMGTLPDRMAWQTHLVILPLALLGGLGAPVLMELFYTARGKRRSSAHRLSNHTMTVLALSAIVYLTGLLLFFVLRLPAGAAQANDILLSSSAAAINTRSGGFPIEYAADFSRPLQWILIVLMVIGAAPGGTGGGLKITTLSTLFTGTRAVFRGNARTRLFGIAIIWLVGFASLIFVSFLLLLWTDRGMEADRLLFLATSAATNCGLSHDRVTIVGNGMYVLTLTMLLGRILPLAILWWVAKHSDETDVAIG